MSSRAKVLLGMIILAVSGLLLGGTICYVGLNAYMSEKVLNNMIKEGYVLTHDATATADDIVKGKTAYVNGQLVEGNIVVFDTSNATATSDVIVKGKTAYVNGELVIGTLPVVMGQTIIPTTVATSIEGGYYLSSDIVIKGSKNLTAANIKDGILVFNVKGTYKVTSEENGGQ